MSATPSAVAARVLNQPGQRIVVVQLEATSASIRIAAKRESKQPRAKTS
jgi:hypothetical protein